MNRSLIELTRYALGKDFLVRRIEREVIESIAADDIIIDLENRKTDI